MGDQENDTPMVTRAAKSLKPSCAIKQRFPGWGFTPTTDCSPSAIGDRQNDCLALSYPHCLIGVLDCRILGTRRCHLLPQSLCGPASSRAAKSTDVPMCFPSVYAEGSPSVCLEQSPSPGTIHILRSWSLLEIENRCTLSTAGWSAVQ